MLHGEFGEDGRVQAVLDDMGLPYAGAGRAASELAIDKHAAKARLAAAGVPVPVGIQLSGPSVYSGADILAERRLDEALAVGNLAFPVVVKPNARGSSVGVSLVRERSALSEAVRRAFEVDNDVLVEEYVDGRELTAGYLDGAMLPLVELAPDGVFYDYHAKYRSDKTRYFCPAELSGSMGRHIQELGKRGVEALGARDLARVDFLLPAGPRGPVALEINTAPGFTSHSLLPMAARAAGLDFTALCLKLVALAEANGGR